MDYAGIVARSFHIARRYRVLWLFGFLLALFNAGGNASNGLRFAFNSNEPSPPSAAVREFLPLIIVLVLVAIAVGIIAAVLSYVAQAALIGLVGEIEEGKHPTVRRGFEIGWSRRALRLFGADLVVVLPVVLVAFLFIGGIIAYAFLAGFNSMGAAGPLLLMCCIFLFVLLLIPVSVVLNVLRKFYYRRIVLADDGVFDAIRNGWQLLRANLGPIAVIWLIMFVIGLAWAMLNFFLIMAAAAMVGGPAMAIYAATRSWIVSALTAIPLVIVATILLTTINALYTVFNSAVWTLTYLQLPVPLVGETE